MLDLGNEMVYNGARIIAHKPLRNLAFPSPSAAQGLFHGKFALRRDGAIVSRTDKEIRPAGSRLVGPLPLKSCAKWSRNVNQPCKIEVGHILFEEIRLLISSNNQGGPLVGDVLFEKGKSNDRLFLFRVCPA